ncbi:MAG: UDP-N-acetylglucosamine 1-carboxyvinyltransferase [Acidimicrobiia bacterium]|nr:UDP-N-acetylglucosamine 1-carboxyvinyltransferase [Acidimicrobiia bacterium]MYC57180.1 UDP-N-acetylglucosamine 1-carboxyvinyltransferase [Acidimicrobiia bacterium]MYG93893.1 UDP-N-acetylglucosamine 1-carboxyvinyltransferase [Acidimicrobiia bacterium]MYI29896.1 UDP-N-acetylglucosamine 1-carboxyvinyltransferase [Acidimicrobiia bacterium]
MEVRPSGPLEGSVIIGGAKNSALKLMAACLLVEGTFVIRNVPQIQDVAAMADVLRVMGVSITRDANTLILQRPAVIEPVAPYEFTEKLRASTAVLGPLLASMGHATVALPGGDNFGVRPIDMHVAGLEAIGCRFEFSAGQVQASVDNLVGDHVLLEFPSVGATENIMMAATLAKGSTVIDNAAREPEIADLAGFLNQMGAQVSGAGTSTITVEGTQELYSAEHTVVADRIEAATFLATLGVAGGEIILEGANHDHMAILCRKLEEMGVRTSSDPSGVWAMCQEPLRAVDVSTLPYPGLPTDCKPLLVAMLSVADGVSIVTENLFSERFRYVDDLVRMGADIRTEGHHAVIRGVDKLSGTTVRAPDIRAGAAMVVAGMAAEGVTTVLDVHHIDRGYEDLVGKLSSLGADVRRIRDDRSV